MKQLDAAMNVISQIENTLDALVQRIAQERDTIGSQNWATIGSMNHVAQRLDEIADFWMELE